MVNVAGGLISFALFNTLLALSLAPSSASRAVDGMTFRTFGIGYKPTTGALAGHTLQADVQSQIRLDHSLSL